MDSPEDVMPVVCENIQQEYQSIRVLALLIYDYATGKEK